jgi:transposase
VELEHCAARSTLSFRQVRRARLVRYAAEGHTSREIAQRLDLNEEVVGRWRRRFHAERLEGLEDRARSGRPRRFPPEQVAEVQAIACELPAPHGLPLGRFTRSELHRLVVERGVTDASASTIWRWRHDDALKSWQQRAWIFVRDPAFRESGARAGPIPAALRGTPVAARRPGDLRRREVPAAGARPSPRDRRRTAWPSALVEFEYRRRGTLAHLAAWDVHHASLFDALSPRPSSRSGGLSSRSRTSVPRSSGSRAAGSTCGSSTSRSTPPGSTRSSSSSRSSSARRSAPTASPRLIGSPIGCCAAASTTARSPDRSTGPSPAPTWSSCSPRSPSASRGLPLRRNGPRSRGRLAAQGCCQRALMIFHPSPVRTRWRYST